MKLFRKKKIGVKIDITISFDDHVITLCKRTGITLNALGRPVKSLALEQRQKLMKAFIRIQFVYRPSVWMVCSRGTNSKINHIMKET